MNLLINEPPLQVLPSLAKQIGLNDAIILQQMHYWIIRSEHYHDGRRWIYNSVRAWVEQFPFWSAKTIQRTIDRLVDNEYVYEGNYNKLAMDQTKWYSINYEKLNACNDAFGQNDQMQLDKMDVSNRSDCPIANGQNDQTNTREYTENTQEKNNCRKQAFDENSPVTKIVNFFVDEIRKNRPDFKGHSKSWFTDMDRILRLDNRDPKEVCRIIRFAQTDDFWKANILSPKKLRQHYDALAIKLQQTNQKANVQKAGAAPVAYKPVELDLNAGED